MSSQIRAEPSIGNHLDQGANGRIGVGLIGCGKRGSNVAAAVERSEAMRLAAVADLNVGAAESLAARLASRSPVLAPAVLLDDDQIDAVLIVTDAASHFNLAWAAVMRGKHVFVEKPLAMSSAESAALVNASVTAGVTLMVGHTFLYSEYVAGVERALKQGHLGKLRYVHLQRLAYGRFPEDANVIRNLGPHDVSILTLWAGRPPIAVRCVEYMFARPTISDLAFLTLDFGDFLGHIQLSCIDPEKVRRATVAGSTGGIVYDDVDGAVRLIANGNGTAPVLLSPGQTCPPLDIELAHFAECILRGSRPKTDGVHGAMVVAVLEAACASAADGGVWIDVTDSLSQLTSAIQPMPSPDKGSHRSLVASSGRMALA